MNSKETEWFPHTWSEEERHALSALTSATLYYDGCKAKKQHARSDVLQARKHFKHLHGLNRTAVLTPDNQLWEQSRQASLGAWLEWQRARDAVRDAEAELKYIAARYRIQKPEVVGYWERLNGR